jgi:hypothetical protein
VQVTTRVDSASPYPGVSALRRNPTDANLSANASSVAIRIGSAPLTAIVRQDRSSPSSSSSPTRRVVHA